MPGINSWQRVAIVGVGLIGGSIGLALRERNLVPHVVGIGRNSQRLSVAQELGAVTEFTTDLATGVREADCVVVCTPVDQVAQHILTAAAAAPPGVFLTDAASTKESIVAELEAKLPEGTNFLGSHPMAGSEKSGVSQARADLYVDRTVVLTPTDKTPSDAVSQGEALWQSIGARVQSMPPAEHDQAVARISHLPHVVAAALAEVLLERDHSLASTGFRDTTRIAAGSPELWQQILLDNAPAVLQALEPFETALSQLRQAIEARDAGQLNRLLTQAQRNRHALGN